MTTPHAAMVERVTKYLDERSRMIGIDPERIHSLHMGTEQECELTATDIRSLLQALEAERGKRGMLWARIDGVTAHMTGALFRASGPIPRYIADQWHDDLLASLHARHD